MDAISINRFTIQLLLLYLYSNTLFSQNRFRRGFVIKNDGMIQPGFIEQHRWDQAPREINFKTDSLSTIIKYKISEIKYFEILDKVAFFRVPVCRPVVIYEDNPEYFFDENSKTVIEGSIDPAPKKINRILPDTCKMDTVFFKLLLEGNKYSLYQSNDLGDNRIHYYMRNAKSNVLNELIYCPCNSKLHSVSKNHYPFRQYIIEKIGKSNLSIIQVKEINKSKPDEFIKLFMFLNQNKAEVITHHVEK